MKHVKIILINWNNSADTIECYNSVVSNCPDNIQILIFDNDSKEHDYLALKDFILSENGLVLSENGLKSYSTTTFHNQSILIKGENNHGFAKANNLCIQALLNTKPSDYYIWLLNNDTIVEKKALDELLNSLQDDPENAVAGSVLLYENNRKIIQAYGGGKFYSLFAASKLLGKGASLSKTFNSKWTEKTVHDLDYVMGASFLINPVFLEKAGLFDEKYFVYVEELDLCVRMKKAGGKLVVANKSYIYHKDASSTRDQREYYFYLLSRNQYYFMRKFYSRAYTLFSVMFHILMILKQTRKVSNIMAAIKGTYDGVKG